MMNKWIILLLILCAIEDQLSTIRPGATYIIHSGDYAGIEWTDKVQVKPTPSEMDQALANCEVSVNAVLNSKQVPITNAKNTGLPVDQRLNALISALGL